MPDAPLEDFMPGTLMLRFHRVYLLTLPIQGPFLGRIYLMWALEQWWHLPGRTYMHRCFTAVLKRAATPMQHGVPLKVAKIPLLQYFFFLLLCYVLRVW